MKQRRKPGDPLTLSSADWNSFLDAAEMVLGGKNPKTAFRPQPNENGFVLVKNTTGADRSQFEVVGLDVVVPTPANLEEFKQQTHQYNAVATVAADHRGRWAILQEPIKNDAIGWAMVSGVGVVKVDGTAPSAYPYFADFIVGDYTQLMFYPGGSAQVLYRDASTEWAIVRLGSASHGPLLAKSGGSGIAANSSATVTLRVPSGGGWTDSAISYTAYNQHPTVAVGNSKIIVIAPIDGRWVVITEFC